MSHKTETHAEDNQTTMHDSWTAPQSHSTSSPSMSII